MRFHDANGDLTPEHIAALTNAAQKEKKRMTPRQIHADQKRWATALEEKVATIARLRAENKRLQARSKVLANEIAKRDDFFDTSGNYAKEMIRLADAEVRKGKGRK